MLRLTIPKTSLTRGLFFLVGDVVLVCTSLYLAFFIRFEGNIPSAEWQAIPLYLAVALPIKVVCNAFFGLYNLTWSLVGVPELLRVLKACLVGSLGTATVLLGFQYHESLPLVPRSVLMLDFVFCFLLVGSLRAAKRIYLYDIRRLTSAGKVRVLVAGAGMAGESLVREMRRSNGRYFPVGFMDDNPAKRGTFIQGVKVLGSREELPDIVRRCQPDEAVIAIPSAQASQIRDIVRRMRDCGLKRIKIVPSLNEFMASGITLNNIRHIQLEDLLGRDTVRIDTKQVSAYLQGKVILITGAAGSIGCELAHQVAWFAPKHVVLFDVDETALFLLEGKLKEEFRELSFSCVLGNICDEGKVNRTFHQFRPQVIFHAAAYKHVPMMEVHPDEAVRVNVFGTLTVASAARRFEAEKFVLISTDKAVNPSSIMGATKRVAEMIVSAMDKTSAIGNLETWKSGNLEIWKPETRFVTVRFGNVLGSRGSAVPIFREQVQHGGPVTVTHPKMKRYFMTAQEAVLLIMQAGAIGQGGEVFVLEMGEPVLILDLAKEVIRQSGYEPDKDIAIVFTGIRPGEKLFEEVLTAEEEMDATCHEKIFRTRFTQRINEREFFTKLKLLDEASRNGSNEEIVSLLKDLVPTYKPAHHPSPSTREGKGGGE